jgi:hypothetical protein
MLRRSVFAGMYVSIALLVCVSAHGGSPARGQFVFYSAKTAEDVSVDSLRKGLEESGTKTTPVFTSQGCAWSCALSGGKVTLSVSPKVVWVTAPVENAAQAQPVLDALLRNMADENGIKLAGNGSFATTLRIPRRVGGKLKVGAVVLPKKPARQYFSFVPEETFRTKHKLAKDDKVSITIEKNTAYWTFKKKGKKDIKEEAVRFVKKEQKKNE